jgi:CubicO group peptidase (beta-lactamase class C family)
MRKIVFLLSLLTMTGLRAQLYFPPLVGDTWQTMNPSELNWCQNKIDSLYEYLESQNTKAFIVLKDGKIVLEQYFNGHAQNTPWYWASAGKTITAFLVGIAQQENLLNINNPSSDYLGEAWTSCTPQQENAITVWHQLTMTSGLDDGVSNPFCTLPACLQFLANPGTRWAYHNGPYTLLDQVIANASGSTLNQYTTQKLKTPTGMTGSFFLADDNMVFFSTARSMARFGLLILNNGNWNGNQIMTDTEYFNAMINTSQQLNRGYGYLWWLNGKPNFMIPGSQITIPGSIMPNAPNDMVSGLGKDGQFVNVVPSQNLVLIRMGEEPTGSLVPFLMNDKIWEYMNALVCTTSSLPEENAILKIFPNPNNGHFKIQTSASQGQICVFDLFGRLIISQEIIDFETNITIPENLQGVYLVQWTNQGNKKIEKIVIR